METIWKKVEEFRAQHGCLCGGALPVDVFSVVELDLRLDIIPFHDLLAKYQVEAALRADFTGIYVDAETYIYLEAGPLWKLKRLRFSLAHELGHFILHSGVPQAAAFASLPDFARWSKDYAGKKYTLEQEANEFAGRLLVPVDRLKEFFAEFEKIAQDIFGDLSSDLREPFCERAAQKFGVNAQVVGVRLDREGIWPAG